MSPPTPPASKWSISSFVTNLSESTREAEPYISIDSRRSSPFLSKSKLVWRTRASSSSGQYPIGRLCSPPAQRIQRPLRMVYLLTLSPVPLPYHTSSCSTGLSRKLLNSAPPLPPTVGPNLTMMSNDGCLDRYSKKKSPALFLSLVDRRRSSEGGMGILANLWLLPSLPL